MRGDICVVRNGEGVVPRLIEWFTESTYYHAFIDLGDGRMIEAEPGGVRYGEIDEYHPDDLLRLPVVLTSEERDGIVAYATAQLGTPYNFVDLVCLALSCEGLIPLPVHRRLADRKSVICSQLCAQAYRSVGVVLFPDKEDYRITPRDLAALALNLPLDPNR